MTVGADHPRFIQRLRRRYAGQLHLLPSGPPTHLSMAAAHAALLQEGFDTGQSLRITRQLVLERLAVLDCEQQAPLHDITRAMTELAEFALDTAWQTVRQQIDEAHGAPRNASGARTGFWVVGMGKLGARELNVSSDIDLIYVYEEDGQTEGGSTGRQLSGHEYFARVVKGLHTLIGESTEHGQVFRMDLALRPNGSAGPPAISLGALEDYLVAQGREWERFAWLKSRVVAPLDSKPDAGVQALRGLVLPFVFRRYLDYNVFDALRDLHRRIRSDAVRRSAGHPERANDVKLSRGGIREIEFIVQLLQVVRGGQFPELRTRPTLDALQRLGRAQLMPTATAEALALAYTFLRRVEHRIQYLDDQQTHVLPTHDDDLAWIAGTMGFADTPGFLCELDAHRELVAQEFDRLLGTSTPECRGKACRPMQPTFDASEWLVALPAPLRERLRGWPEHPRVLALREDASARLMRLVQQTGAWVNAEPEGGSTGSGSRIQGALRWADWIEPLLRRDSYLALLVERPWVHQRLLQLLATARWPARYLLRHPGVIDELAGVNLLEQRFQPAALEAELEQRLRALQSTAEADDEALLNLLRRAHHAEMFRTLARDVEGRLTVEEVADDLSALADTVLRVTCRWCWHRLRQRHRDEPLMAIIGYGKLGGKELGYGSDLDIVFVYDDEDECAPEVYAAFVRKLIGWLTIKTSEGDLFEIDTALRPNGGSGLLVTRFSAYADYQQQRGSNTAWTWEHQAMTRARCVLGSADLAQRFQAVREAVITAPRQANKLREEIMGMRQRLRAARPVPDGQFDVKHSPCGMVDAEFAVQWLVLAHAAQHPPLRDNVGNIALLQRAEACGLLPQGVGQAAASAYRSLRRVQHAARLDEQPTQVDNSALQAERAAIGALWRAAFGD